jgi:capsular polysaccharide export protein
MSDLHIVFLQGMPSSFFSRIAQYLNELGCKTTGINLCVGDSLFWRGDNTVNYRGRLADWPEFFREFLLNNHVTDLVLLGEQRSYHKPTVAIAQSLGVRVTVTDFGYLRPDWITLERDGMSGNSRFPKAHEEVAKLADNAPALDTIKRYQDSALAMSLGDLAYSFSNVFFGWLYPFYRRSDKRPHPLIYFPAMGYRLLYNHCVSRREHNRLNTFLANQPRYFVFPLQLEHDFQIVAYSPFDSLGDAIQLALKSFAEHAASNTYLVFKIHPWDPGLQRWQARIQQWAKDFGVAERVLYFDGGSLDAMIEQAAGMVTVNSTSGIRALQLGCPVVTLGQAIYECPGLTHQQGLDSFWQAPETPDQTFVEAFLRAMAATIQIRGVFFSEPGMSVAAKTAAERLYQQTVGISLPQ